MENKKTSQKAYKRKQIVYNTDDIGGHGVSFLAESAFEYTASCPICAKRIFDSTDIPGNSVHVRLKCPHCKRIINIPFSSVI